MKINLNLIEEPFVLQAKNEDGVTLTIDAAESIGGKGKGLRPMEILASSLAGCMAIDVLLILRKQRQTITHFEIEVDAKRANAIPAVFEEITLIFILNEGVNEDKLQSAIHLTHEKYCSVSQSLNPNIKINIESKLI